MLFLGSLLRRLRQQPGQWLLLASLGLLLGLGCGEVRSWAATESGFGITASPAVATIAAIAGETVAQAPPASSPPASRPENTPTEGAAATDAPTPATPSQQPLARPQSQPKSQPQSQYIMAFNRSPIVGNRLRLSGVYPETRLGFTRPKDWQVQSATAIVRYQHSPSLLSNQSFLTVRVNDTSVGSIPLDTPDSQIAEASFTIPPELIQDFNDLTILAEQQTSETCTNPADPTLWTEIMPDSKLILDYVPQSISLDFSQYPYPFIDTLRLEPNRLTYLQPTALDTPWLTNAAQFQSLNGRLAAFSELTTQLVTDVEGLRYNDGLIVLGTPAEQPAVAAFDLPFALESGEWLDSEGQPIAGDIGLLMLTRLPQGSPVLVVTGNQPEGVTKAVQALVQVPNRQLGTGPAVLVQSVPELPSPAPRQWPGYLPAEDTFTLADLTFADGEPIPNSVMVRGASPQPVRINFKALPDDQFVRGSSMTLDYSYSPQVNPRTSSVEVKLDGTTIAAKRLKGRGGSHERFRLELPAELIQPTTQMDVQFVLQPREADLCGLATDDQLWGEVHSDTQFSLERGISAEIPDLSLFQTGFPLTMPQDLSQMAVALPDAPNISDVETLLALSERLGRLTQAESVKLAAYRASDIPETEKTDKHWAAIGTRDRFPLSDIFAQGSFELSSDRTRQWQNAQMQPLIDNQGLVQAVTSPWNEERMVVAFTSQTEAGMAENRNLLQWDQLFYRLRGDTVLLSRTQPNPSRFNPGDYRVISLSRAKTVQLTQVSWKQRLFAWLQNYWLLVPLGTVLVALLLYGLSQLYLNRSAQYRSES
ncbi:MAG: cellulose biosynthesis cyclic di-GMP-binding regulatory protein BcsB [Cyanobacteria bacterium P01_A01_bin.105]